MSDAQKAEDLGTEIRGIAEELKGLIEASRSEAKAAGAVSGELKTRIVEVAAELSEANAELRALKGRMDEGEASRKRGIVGAGLDGGGAKSWGAQVAESDVVKEIRQKGLKSYGEGRSIAAFDLTRKSSVLTTTIVDGRQPMFDPEINAVPDRGPVVRPLLTAVPTSDGSVEFVKETDFSAIYAENNSSSASGQKNIVLQKRYSGAGFKPGSTIRLTTTDGLTTETKVIDTVTIQTDRDASTGGTIVTTVNLSNTYAAGSTITSTEYDCTPEAVLAPVAKITTANTTVPVESVSTFIEVSARVLDDTARLQDYIDRRLSQRHGLNVEAQILNGAGAAGKSLTGILQDADIQTFAWSAGTIGDGRADAVLRGVAYAALSEYSPDAIVMHDLTWVDIVSEKGSDDHYMNQGISVQGTQRSLWGLPVSLSPKMTQGVILIGSFGMGATLYEREAPMLTMSNSHADNFARGIIAMMLTERLALTVERPEAFVKVTLDVAPS